MKHFAYICCITLLLSTSAQAAVKERTFSGYSADIIGQLQSDINNTQPLQKPINDILSKGNQEQLCWLGMNLAQMDINTINESAQQQYFKWEKETIIRIMETDSTLRLILDGRDPRQTFDHNFYPHLDIQFRLYEAASYLDETISYLSWKQITAQRPEYANLPEFEQACREILSTRSFYLEHSLFGNYQYCQRTYSRWPEEELVNRIANKLFFPSAKTNPQLFTQYVASMNVLFNGALMDLSKEIVIYSLYYLSQMDMNLISSRIRELANQAGRTDQVLKAFEEAALIVTPLKYKDSRQAYESSRKNTEANQALILSFSAFQDSLRLAGKEFVNYPPTHCPEELTQDPLFDRYVSMYVKVGHVFCQAYAREGGAKILTQYADGFRNLLRTMGYYHPSIPTDVDWQSRWAYYLSELKDLTQQYYYDTHEAWAIGAVMTETSILADLSNMIRADIIFYEIARSIEFFHFEANNTEFIKYLLDNFLFPYLPQATLQTKDHETNCWYLWFYAQVLPYTTIYDEPERSKLSKFYVKRLLQGIKFNPDCENNAIALLSLADYYYRNMDAKSTHKYIQQYLEQSGDSLMFWLYEYPLALTIEKDYARAAHLADILNADDSTMVASYFAENGLSPARAYGLAGQTSKALQQLNVFNTYMRHEIGKHLLTIGSSAETMLSRYNDIGNTLAQLSQDPLNDTLRNEIIKVYYNWQLQSKGILLALNSEAETIYTNHPDSDIRNLHQRLKQKEAELSAFTDQESFDALTLKNEIDIIRWDLLLAIQQYTDQHGFAGVNLTEWQEVRNALRPGEVAIEFASGELENEENDPTYFALLLRQGNEQPTAVRLFRESQLMKLIGGKNEMQIYDDIDLNNRVVQMIIHPLENYLQQGDNVYFAATGALHQIALENMYYADEQPLSDRYHLHRVSSTRQLLSRTDHTQLAPQDSVMLYGGILYETDNATLKAQSDLYPDQQLARRAVSTADINRGQAGFLPGSLREVQYIDSLLDQSAHPKHMLSGTQANEESFKALSGHDNAILHIATHGFFWEKDSAANYRYLSASVNEESALRNIDPMRRCGLLMAGANTALSGRAADLPPGVQDGVLTAQEISLLDLSRTKLVILSACETGIGELNSDGVFGLQRAFKRAGVETLIMSLWKVSDKATQLLMTEFYRNWLNGQDKHTAFRSAQDAVRERYEEPTYWAGFIMLD